MYFLRGPGIALLCGCLAVPELPGVAQPPAPSPDRPARARYQAGQLQGEQRIVHALNRLTFGPRPGDLEAVRSLGLEIWFDQQLHPGSLNQAPLNARLAQYPAMRLSPDALLAQLPSNALIRQAIDGKLPVPERGVEKAIYEDQMYRVSERQQNKQEKQEQATAATTAKLDAGSAATLKRLQDLVDTPEGGDKSMNEGPARPTSASAVPAASVVTVLAPAQRIARLATLAPADADAFFKSVKGPDRTALEAGLNPDQRETLAALENPQRTVDDELVAERLTRDIYSSAQLQEVMTDFWLNHFNVFLHKNEATPYYLVSYERDVIRPRALGKFEDLLEATAHSPAMLLYLDNASSTGPDSQAAARARLNAMRDPAVNRKAPEGLNENYARELMELHTVGVNGGYTQADVTQVARILTGWTVDRPQRGGTFRFAPNRHEPGTKKVMGKKFKENGEQEGRDLLHFLATRPATARFISRQLAVRFVSDDPPASLVDRMAATYMKTSGDIASVMKTMFHSQEFWSPAVYQAKVKTPLEYVVSAVRAGNADVENLQPLANALRDLGMPVYGAVPPTGYKWDAADWVSTGALVTRMNFALSLAANRLPGIAMHRVPAGAGPVVPVPDTEAEEVRLEVLLLPAGASPATRSAVLEQAATQSAGSAPNASPHPVQVAGSVTPQPHAAAPSALDKQDQLLVGLLLGSPEFQRR